MTGRIQASTPNRSVRKVSNVPWKKTQRTPPSEPRLRRDRCPWQAGRQKKGIFRRTELLKAKQANGQGCRRRCSPKVRLLPRASPHETRGATFGCFSPDSSTDGPAGDVYGPSVSPSLSRASPAVVSMGNQEEEEEEEGIVGKQMGELWV